jgi:hypothetical protein
MYTYTKHVNTHTHTHTHNTVSEEEGRGQIGEELEESDVVDIVEMRYLFDPNNPYDDSSTDDEVPDTDVNDLAEAFG